ncbi:MAG: ATP-binding protein [Actinomadura sp.]
MIAIKANSAFPIESEPRFQLTATRDAPAQARALIEATFIDWELRHLIRDGKLITSELVTNSAVATPDASIWLLLAWEPDAVIIGVWDSSPILPKKRPCHPDSESGWGLHIVDALATCNGAFPVTRPDGKITWAELATLNRLSTPPTLRPITCSVA